MGDSNVWNGRIVVHREKRMKGPGDDQKNVNCFKACVAQRRLHELVIFHTGHSENLVTLAVCVFAINGLRKAISAYTIILVSLLRCAILPCVEKIAWIFAHNMECTAHIS